MYECSREPRAGVCVSNSGETCKTRWLISFASYRKWSLSEEVRAGGSAWGAVMVQGKVSANLWSSPSWARRGCKQLGWATETLFHRESAGQDAVLTGSALTGTQWTRLCPEIIKTERKREATPAKHFPDDELGLSKPPFCRVHMKAADVGLQQS